MVAGGVAILILPDLALLVGERVPDGRPFAVRIPAALYLIGGGGHAPGKIFAKRHRLLRLAQRGVF